MKARINSYFAILLITIAGAAAALIIIHVANENTFNIIMVNGGTDYGPLERSILTH